MRNNLLISAALLGLFSSYTALAANGGFSYFHTITINLNVPGNTFSSDPDATPTGIICNQMLPGGVRSPFRSEFKVVGNITNSSGQTSYQVNSDCSDISIYLQNDTNSSCWIMLSTNGQNDTDCQYNITTSQQGNDYTFTVSN